MTFYYILDQLCYKTSPDLYGEKFVTYNVHSLLHLVDDCVRYQRSLNGLSIFPFESRLHQLKRKILGSKNKLVQLCKKLSEENTPQGKQAFKKLHVTVRKPNNCFAISDVAYCILKEDNYDGTYQGLLVKQDTLENFYGNNLESTMLGIGRVSVQTVRRLKLCQISRRRLLGKVACIKHEHYFYFVPLLHAVDA